MFESPTWDAILQEWPWFAAAAVVFVVAVGLLIAVKPGTVRKSEIIEAAVDNMGWTPTGRIDFSDSNAVGKLMLEVEETRAAIGATGVERREIRWRSATVDEAKMVLESYSALRNLAKTATFTVSSPTSTKPSGQGERMDAEIKDAPNGKDMAGVTLVPQDAPH
jgi:hypothetical protein